MKMSKHTTIQSYIDSLSPERQSAISDLRKVINDHIPDGFQECINYGMIGRAVPHSLYPDGYHCDPKLPLPFLNLASQKSYIALYHMGVYSDPDLLERFVTEHAARVSTKLDMGKSCIRFKKIDQIPMDLIGELVSKISVAQWIDIYEQSRS